MIIRAKAKNPCYQRRGVDLCKGNDQILHIRMLVERRGNTTSICHALARCYAGRLIDSRPTKLPLKSCYAESVAELCSPLNSSTYVVKVGNMVIGANHCS